MATHLISCRASNVTKWLFRLSPPSAHHFLINMLLEAREVKGGGAGGSCIPTLGTCWNLPPLTNKWSERLAKSNILFKHTLVRWRCGSLLSNRNRRFLSTKKFSCGIYMWNHTGAVEESGQKKSQTEGGGQAFHWLLCKQKCVHKPLKLTCRVNEKSHISMDFSWKPCWSRNVTIGEGDRRILPLLRSLPLFPWHTSSSCCRWL